MDSKVVAREIKQRIWPSLEDAGFTRFTSKVAWRPRKTSVQVVCFQSFNASLASGVGCTTFSFAIRCGVYYPSISRVLVPATEPEEFPKEYLCPARLTLMKPRTQPELPRRDVWYVRPDGSNLAELIEDARKLLLDRGLPWLESFSDVEKAYDAFQRVPSTDELDLGGTVGCMGRDDVLRALKLVIDPLRHGAERGYDPFIS